MSAQQVKVKGDKFEPASQQVASANSLSFINKRSQSVTINLSSGFFNPTSLTLAGEGQSGDSGSVNIIVSTGTGYFSAPKQGSASPKQDDKDIKGDIIINPNK